MGRILKKNSHYVYVRDDGEVTARFETIEEKKSLVHRGSRGYRTAFYLLVGAGGLYLALLLGFVR